MKKMFGVIFMLLVLITTGCGSNNVEFSVETAPKYRADQSYPIVIKATEKNEPVGGLEIVATLEMLRMDHGLIEVFFTDNGDGTYEGEVALPMGGEWIANIVTEKNGKEIEDMVTFQVSED